MSIADIISLLLVALSLSADCFAVALGASFSFSKMPYIRVVRMPTMFGVFQALMPAIGWFIGRTIIDYITDYDHWVAFILLAIIGGRMLRESFHEEEMENGRDYTKWVILLTLSIATSIDALAVGLSFALVHINIVIACLVIGVVAFIIANIGIIIGKKVGSVFGKRAKAIGGIVLIGIGLRILLTHLLG